MSAEKDWLPSNHALLYSFAVQLWNFIVIPNNRDRMGFAVGTQQGNWLDMVFAPVFNPYTSAYVQWMDESDRTPAKSAVLKDAETALKTLLRKLYKGFLKDSPLVTDEDLVHMGLPPRHTGGNTPVKVPDKNPAAKADTSQMHQVKIDFYEDNGTHRKAKPDGVHGAEIKWGIFEEPPVDAEALPHSSFDTHTPFILNFEGHDRGKILYFALRWENTRGIKGPFGPILNAVIP
ncbi:MAG: hypothetical protein LBN98_00560 [Prevotellaceae bacterium]|jgi:hypothetical protein|nr:hypothetical protein [Prevotellaceae bacterium]